MMLFENAIGILERFQAYGWLAWGLGLHLKTGNEASVAAWPIRLSVWPCHSV